MTPEAFQELMIKEPDDHAICQKVLLSSDVWLLRHKGFEDSRAAYDEVKLFFAGRLSIPNANVAIVGSAKLGFSLNPFNAYRKFDDEESDIDVILVSQQKFENFWVELLQLFYGRGAFVGPLHHKDVFRKFVTLERDVDFPSDLLREWHQTMDELKRDFFTNFNISNPIKYRVYESWDAVNAYHAQGIRQLRSKLG